MRILIDATDSGSRLDLFGMTLLERQLHAIVSAGLAPAVVHVALGPGTPVSSAARASLPAQLSIRWSCEPGSLYERILGVLREGGGGPLLVLDGTCVIDTRLLQFLAAQSGTLAARGREGSARGAILRVDGSLHLGGEVEGDLSRLVDLGIARGVVEELPLASIPSYIKKLRRDLPIYLFRVTDAASRDQAERFLFESNYKGSTDFFTKYVYPPFVWRLVGPLSRWRVHPNIISAFNVGITFLAVFLWAWDWWWFGFVLAYTMSLLDSVDGKLARLTFTSSWAGDILDHGLDVGLFARLGG